MLRHIKRSYVRFECLKSSKKRSILAKIQQNSTQELAFLLQKETINDERS